MTFKRTRRPSPSVKEAIIRGVFDENLRISGKGSGIDPPAARSRGKPHRLLVAVLAAVFCLIPELIPDLQLSLSEKNVSNPALATAPLIGPEATAAAAGPDPARPAPLPALGEVGPLLPDPLQEPAIADGRDFIDYSLLLSDADQVRLVSLFGLDIRRIVIDPGHGGTDPGAIGAMGTREKDITLGVALCLKEKLIRSGNLNVLLTRDRDRTLALADRVAFARKHKADLFISLHVNSLPNQSVNAVETYYFGPPLNTETLRLAEHENRESNYTIRELTAIIQDIGNVVKRQESARLAGAIQKSLLRHVRLYDAEVYDVGVKTAPFVVLSQIEVPSVLVEMSCLTNEKEEAKLASAEYREKVASFIEDGINSYFGKMKPLRAKGEKNGIHG